MMLLREYSIRLAFANRPFIIEHTPLSVICPYWEASSLVSIKTKKIIPVISNDLNNY